MKKDVIHRISLMVAVLTVMVPLAACASGAAPAATGTPSAPAAREKAQPPDWQTRWDNVLSLARKEGQVMVYGAALAPKVRDAMAKGFEGRHSIKLEFVIGSSAEITARWDKERSAGINIADHSCPN